VPLIVGQALLCEPICEMCEYSVCGISTRVGADAKSSYVSTVLIHFLCESRAVPYPIN
jgi:hypothetical protein